LCVFVRRFSGSCGKLAGLISSGILSVRTPAQRRELALSLGVSRETIRGAIMLLDILRVAGARGVWAQSDFSAARTSHHGSGPYRLESVHEARLLG
jgi:DNA-binding FadR family transcriptional regulator